MQDFSTITNCQKIYEHILMASIQKAVDEIGQIKNSFSGITAQNQLYSISNLIAILKEVSTCLGRLAYHVSNNNKNEMLSFQLLNLSLAFWGLTKSSVILGPIEKIIQLTELAKQALNYVCKEAGKMGGANE